MWSYTTVRWLKELVATSLDDGTPAESLRLIFFGRQLPDRTTMADNNKEDTMLHVAIMLRGGGTPHAVFQPRRPRDDTG